MASDEPPCVIAVFARAPIAGATKTRLIPALGAQGASDLHCDLVERTLATADASSIGPIELWCAPDTNHPFFAECARRLKVTLHTQCEGHIGTRMLHAMTDILARGALPVLIGTDCPALTPMDLRHSAEALRAGRDAVLMPVADGGYTLIALRTPRPELFASIDWSTDRVMSQTRDLMRRLQWDWLELAERWDLDRPEDLPRWHAIRTAVA